MNRRPDAAAIELDEVSKSFETANGRVNALSTVDLTVQEGEFLGVVGPSGSGKTTLLRLIAGLDRPSAGTVRIGGRSVENGPDTGFVFQEVTLFPWRTVEENVRLGLEVGDSESIDRRVDELLAMVGLADRRTASPEELSGGMATRVGIARALAPDPEILLLDEPFADLDVATRERLQDDLLALWDRLGKTVVLVTHTVGEAVRLADRVLVLQGPPGHVASVVDVDLDRPRDPDTDPYRPYVRSIRNAIRGDSRSRGSGRGEGSPRRRTHKATAQARDHPFGPPLDSTRHLNHRTIQPDT